MPRGRRKDQKSPYEGSTTLSSQEKYPWGVWFLLPTFTLTRGVHFHKKVLPHGMAQTVRQAARRYGIRVQIAHTSINTLKVTVLGER